MLLCNQLILEFLDFIGRLVYFDEQLNFIVDDGTLNQFSLVKLRDAGRQKLLQSELQVLSVAWCCLRCLTLSLCRRVLLGVGLLKDLGDVEVLARL